MTHLGVLVDVIGIENRQITQQLEHPQPVNGRNFQQSVVHHRARARVHAAAMIAAVADGDVRDKEGFRQGVAVQRQPHFASAVTHELDQRRIEKRCLAVQRAQEVFGADGNLYVADNLLDEVQRFNGTTGAFIDTFVSGTGIASPDIGLIFGPDGNLYVSNLIPGEVTRFNGTTGVFIDVFAETNDSTNGPEGMAFGPDGNLYVATTLVGVERFNGTTGAFIDTFISGLDGNDVVFANFVPEPATSLLLVIGSLAVWSSCRLRLGS